jgi:hypothetical protein
MRSQEVLMSLTEAEVKLIKHLFDKWMNDLSEGSYTTKGRTYLFGKLHQAMRQLGLMNYE